MGKIHVKAGVTALERPTAYLCIAIATTCGTLKLSPQITSKVGPFPWEKGYKLGGTKVFKNGV
jgi:hypothetical protein